MDFHDLWVVLRGVKTKTALFTMRLSGRRGRRSGFLTQGRRRFGPSRSRRGHPDAGPAPCPTGCDTRRLTWWPRGHGATSNWRQHLRQQRFDTPGLQMAYDAAFDAMLATVDRRDRLDLAIAQMAADSEFAPVADRLQCVRGISTLTAFALAVDVGDWHRFTGRSIGAYLGLVPTEYSSGSSRVQGGLTKTGNGHVRRLLIGAAWHHRKPYRPGRRLRQRWETATPAARARGHAANRRLNARWVRFDQRQKRPAIANAAIARELAGWCWSLAVLDG